ncbi:MAG: adenylate/guanylate cyclase protein [Bacillota bacterium]|nr:adenylate/guanylate cyclase protein [Bacillota bacterium]
MKNYLRYMYILLIIILLSTTIFIITNNDIELKTVQSEKGKIDLNEWDESTLLKLTGEWQYYDGLMIKDIEKTTSEEYVYVPHTFKRNENVGNNPYGTATYKLRISGLNKEVHYSIQILSITSAYRLTANGNEVLKAGRVGYTQEEHEPEMMRKLGYFSPDEDGNVELLIEVSNYSYNYGGFWRNALLGDENMMYKYSSQQEREQIFLFSSLLILGLFFLGLYSINGSFKPLLYFSFICLLTSIRVLLTNYKLFYDFIYYLSWDAGTRIEFLTGYLLLPLFGMFFNSMNYEKPNKYVDNVCKLFIAISILITAFTANKIYANLLQPYIWLCVICLPYFGYVLFEALKRKMAGVKNIIVGTVAVIICMLADSFMNIGYDILPIGTFFLLINYSVVVIKNLVQVIQQNDYLEEVVTTDSLTGLYNRYYLNRLIKKGFKLEDEKRLYVLFFDLDKFKYINDEYGHSVGDEILRESSKRLKESFHRETDILCRYGGDEFVAFVSVKDNDRNIEGIIKRIKKSFTEPILVGENNFFITVSIGVSEFHDGDDMEKTIHRSDYAMYAEKQSNLKVVFDNNSI